MNRRKLIISLGLTLLLCFPLINNATANTVVEVDWVLSKVYLGTPIVTGFVARAAEHGIAINAIGVENYELDLRLASGDYDLLSGFYFTFFSDTINELTITLYYYFLLKISNFQFNDAKLNNQIMKLVDYYYKIMSSSEEDLEDAYDDFLNKFHDIEERLFEHQYLFTEISFLYYYAYPMVKLMIPNCLGVLADEELRLTLSSLIDREAIAAFTAIVQPEPVTSNIQPTVHLYSWSQYHDTSLPNEIII